MTILEYIRELNRVKSLAVDRWGILTTIERQVVDGTFEWLLDNLDIKRGTIQTNDELTKSMNNFLQAVVDIVNNNRLFQSKLGSFLSDLSTLQENTKKFHATTNNFNIETLGVTNMQKAVVNEVVEQYLGNGLNAGFAEPLRDGVFRNILLSANIKDVKQTLQNYIIGEGDKTGKLQQYLHNTAIQAVDTYTGAINQQLVKEFTFTGFIISGSLIATSSSQCKFAIESSKNGYLTMKEWEGILALARANKKAPLIPGTTLKTLPLNKLHWGCRHEITPIVV